MSSLNLIFCCLWCFSVSALPATPVETYGLSFIEPGILVRLSPFLHGHSDQLYGLKMLSKYTFFVCDLQLCLDFAINSKDTELLWFLAKCWK